MSEQERIRKSLESTCQEFHRLLDSIPPAYWAQSIPGEDWTIQMEMAHILQIMMLLPGVVERVCKRKRSFSLLSLIPLSLRYWINGHIIVPTFAKKFTPELTSSQFDQTYQDILARLGTLSNPDLQRPVRFGYGLNRTIETIFYRPEEHFKEHREAVMRKIHRLSGSATV